MHLHGDQHGAAARSGVRLRSSTAAGRPIGRRPPGPATYSVAQVLAGGIETIT